MKNLLIQLLILLTSATCMATIHEVDNSGNNPGIFQTITAAMNAANPGDTIYVQGTVNNYQSNLVVNKRVVLIGSGHKPNKQAPITSQFDPFGGITFSPGSSGSVIKGFIMDGGINISVGVDSMVITDNRIGQLTLAGANHLIETNIIGPLGTSSQATSIINTIIRNNVITGQIGSFNQPTVEVTNNVFLNSGQLFYLVSNILFKNNIVLKPDLAGASGVTFLNNITYQSTTVIPYGTNTGSGNFNNIDPEFVNVPTATTGFDYSYDFHLQNTSPGINAGTDGTNIGVYGGLSPFKMGGEPPIPMVKEFIIWNSIVPVGSSIDVSVTGETQQ
jgi:hypothetical protein